MPAGTPAARRPARLVGWQMVHARLLLPVLLLFAAGSHLALARKSRGTEGTTRKSKEEWAQSLSEFQQGENQEFMREYEEQQEERARLRAKNAPKFDPTNPSKYIKAMANDEVGASVVGGVGGAGGNPDGAQITFVRLKPGVMKRMEDTEELVARWRNILTTIGLAAFPHVMSKDQLLMNTQEGWRVPDMRSFVMDQDEVRYFEHNGHKTYCEGCTPDPAADTSGALTPEDEEEARARAEAAEKAEQKRQKRKKKQAEVPVSSGGSVEGANGHESPPSEGGESAAASGSSSRARRSTREWSADWGECTGCRRACGAVAAQTCTIDTLDLSTAEFDPEDFAARYRGRRPLLLRNASANLHHHESRSSGGSGGGGSPWSRPALLERYGNVEVQLSSPISQVDGRGAAVADAVNVRMSFRRYVEELMVNLDEAKGRELTLLDARSGLAAADLWGLKDFSPSVLLNQALLPPPASQTSTEEDGEGAEEWGMSFAVGWPGSGVPFHVRREGWSELLYSTQPPPRDDGGGEGGEGEGGMKIYLYPPDVTPAHGYNVHRSALEWVKRAYKKSGKWSKKLSKEHKQHDKSSGSGSSDKKVSAGAVEPPLECMQRAGDVLYIPSGWYRSSVACGETVAVGGERRSPGPDLGDETPGGAGAGYMLYMGELTQGMDLVAQGRHQEAAAALRKADRLSHHSNDAVLYNLGRVLGHIHGASRSKERPDEAISALKQCVAVNRYNARCWLYLCVAEVQAGNLEGAATIFDRAWALLPPAVTEDENTDEMKLISKLKKVFQAEAQRQGKVPRQEL